jgi:hypothetical protein
MSKVLVTLDYEELEYCAHAGVNRQIRALQKNRVSPTKDLDYAKQNYWSSHITGVIGEYAVSKALGEHWVDLGQDRGGFDVLSYQVRATEQTKPMLRVRAHNNFEHMYILAQVRKNRVLIHGWASGHDVKQFGILEYENCWSLHADGLNDMSLLIHPTIYTSQVTEWERPDYQ